MKLEFHEGETPENTGWTIIEIEDPEIQAAQTLLSITSNRMIHTQNHNAVIGYFKSESAAIVTERRIKEEMEPQTNSHSSGTVYERSFMGSSSHNFKPTNS